MSEEKDVVGEGLRRMEAKYKSVSNQELRFLVNDYLVPVLESMREEYTDLVLGAEEDDEAVDLAESGMDAVVSLGQILDVLTESGTKVPPELQAQFEAARVRAAEFSERAKQVLDEVDEGDDDDDGEDDE